MTALLFCANVAVKTWLFMTNKTPTQEDGKLIRENEKFHVLTD